MSSLPEDIIVEILSCLPVKSLLRYRSVCSSWLHLIDSPYFISHHLSRNSRSISKFILMKKPYWDGACDLYNFDYNSISQPPNQNPSLSLVKFPTKIKPRWWKVYHSTIISSINGLVCIFNFTSTNNFIFNPSTRRYQKLPQLPVEIVDTYGFGFDKLNNDYKVIVIAPLRNSFKKRVLVYVLRSNLWKTLEFMLDNVAFKIDKTVCCGVCVSGSIHWIVSRINEHRVGPNVIAAFDLAIEEYRFMLLPECSNTLDEYTTTMDVLQGCLCLSYGYYNYNRETGKNGTYVDVFVMKEYGIVDSWTKLYVIELRCMTRPVVWARALSLGGGRRRVLLEVEMSGLLWFDLDNKSVEHIKLREEGIVVNFRYHQSSVGVSESLVPLSYPRRMKRKRTQLRPNSRLQA